MLLQGLHPGVFKIHLDLIVSEKPSSMLRSGDDDEDPYTRQAFAPKNRLIIS